MDPELDQLLGAAKANILKQNPPKDSKNPQIESIVGSIPRLQTTVKADPAALERTAKPQEKTLKSIALRNAKEEKPDTAGKQWFDMGKPEMTPALKRDLQLLKMRHVLDPKRHYKREDAPSKYFAVGTIKEDPTEFFSNRLTRKQRKQTLAEEVLSTRADYFKSKYRDIQKAKTSGRRKHQKKLRDMRA